MGIIFFDKPTGITSFDALRDIKRSLGTGKVGHTGTLDKFAQGLLIVLTGRDLKLSRWFTSCDKKYLAKIRFGLETDTLDPEGKPIAEAPLPSREDVEQVLPQFTGDILQAPPAYSAMRINGKRASDLTRSGEAPEMKKRPVKIHQLELQSWQPPFAEIFVHCSSGTYIRSLARDIALAAGSRGYLVELTRTQVAGFCLQADRGEGIGNHLPVTKSIITTLGVSCFDITTEKAQDVRNGKLLEKILEDVPLELLKECTTAALFCDEELVAVVERAGNRWGYGCVFPETKEMLFNAD